MPEMLTYLKISGPAQFTASVSLGLVVSTAAALVAAWLVARPHIGKEMLNLLSKSTTVDVFFYAFLFVAMLAGIGANYFWTHPAITSSIDWYVLARPTLISPIIFMPVYVAATKQPKGVIPILVAFQNGFFWQTIFDRAGPIAAS